MPTTNDALSLVRADQIAADQRAQKMREWMPGVAQLVDEVRQAFPGAKVKYAKEGDREVGKSVPFEGADVEKILLHVDLTKQRKRRHG